MHAWSSSVVPPNALAFVSLILFFFTWLVVSYAIRLSRGGIGSRTSASIGIIAFGGIDLDLECFRVLLLHMYEDRFIFALGFMLWNAEEVGDNHVYLEL